MQVDAGRQRQNACTALHSLKKQSLEKKHALLVTIGVGKKKNDCRPMFWAGEQKRMELGRRPSQKKKEAILGMNKNIKPERLPAL